MLKIIQEDFLGMYAIKTKTWKKWVNCHGPMICFNKNRNLKLPRKVLLSREIKSKYPFIL